MQDKPTRITFAERVHRDYTVRIARPITEADDFDDELQLLQMAQPSDSILFQLVTPGGNLDTANLICKAISESPARTRAFIGSTCASAGTAIALACDEWELDENSSFMIHTASFGSVGKAPELRSHTEHTLHMIDRWVRNTYTGFLTEDEIERVIDGRDMYFEGEELVERLERYALARDIAMGLVEEEEEEIPQKPVDIEEDGA